MKPGDKVKVRNAETGVLHKAEVVEVCGNIVDVRLTISGERMEVWRTEVHPDFDND